MNTRWNHRNPATNGIDTSRQSCHNSTMMDPSKLPVSLCFALILCHAFTPSLSSAKVKKKVQQVRAASDMKQIALAFNNYAYYDHRYRYTPNSFQSMEDFIRIMAEKGGLTDAAVFLSYDDAQYFKQKLPKVTGLRNSKGSIEFDQEIMDFPIAFSVAIYPDLNGPATMTPLLWTRGMHNYKNFDQPYGGHITYMDGHVTYYEGKPGKPHPELDAIFGPGSEFSKAVRILEHEPAGWKDKMLAPLPVRIEEAVRPSPYRHLALLVYPFGPALIAAILVGLLPKPTKRKRILDGCITFGVVLIATLILFPSVVC
ncbi:MAG: hypothetical protein ACPGSB_10630 [Opitutales bacterium]